MVNNDGITAVGYQAAKGASGGGAYNNCVTLLMFYLVANGGGGNVLQLGANSFKFC